MSPLKDKLLDQFHGALGPRMIKWAQSRGKDVLSNVTLNTGPVVPLMGFHEEQYIPGHPDGNTNTGWSDFYTCIANGKRVYVWSFGRKPETSCCIMVSDMICDPARGASVAELQHMFARQHREQKERRISRTHQIPSDPFLVQAFIHEVTCAGNEADQWIGVRT